MTTLELTCENWFRERNELNHNWLGSVFFLEVSALRSRCIGETSGVGCIGESISSTLNAWHAHKDRVAVLIKTCVTCATPALAFNHPPLSRCEADILEWLPDLIHRRWLTKHEILDLTLVAEQSLRLADEAAEGLDLLIQNDDCSNARLASAVDSFLVALTELSKAIGRLPKRTMFA